MKIELQYAPVAPRRRAVTKGIADALRAMKARPTDEAGNPASFTLPAKHRAAVRIAPADTGVEVKTRLEDGDLCRVWLAGAADPADRTAPLPFTETSAAA